MRGNQCMNSKQVNTVCPTVGVLSWVYTHTKLVVLLEESLIRQQNIHKTVARRLIRLEIMPL